MPHRRFALQRSREEALGGEATVPCSIPDGLRLWSGRHRGAVAGNLGRSRGLGPGPDNGESGPALLCIVSSGIGRPWVWCGLGLTFLAREGAGRGRQMVADDPCPDSEVHGAG